MNGYTKEIAKLLDVPMVLAMCIQDRMNIDFSECTQAEFNREARLVYKLLTGLSHGKA